MSGSQAILTVALCYISFQLINGCSEVILRSEWNARVPKSRKSLEIIPPPYVVIHHSESASCTTMETCKTGVKNIQNFHMETRGWDDIGYNFLIGGDGNIYEGRGYGTFGAHHPKYNRRSIGICLLGNFKHVEPPEIQLRTLEEFIDCMKNDTKIKSNYMLIGHRQGRNTDCPGDKLFDIIKTWPNFESHPR